jgi:hypothetical protein
MKWQELVIEERVLSVENPSRHVSHVARHAARPWHRELWPWLLMSGPVAVVIASAATLWLSIASNDGLVADDYYKRGLAINQTLSREQRAAAGNYRAQVLFSNAFDRMRIVLSGEAMPAALDVRFVHATRAGLDQRVRLPAIAPGVYEASLRMPHAGSWRLIVQDEAGTWRLHGECIVPTQTTLTLQAQ